MLLRLFRGTGPGVVLITFITAVAVWCGAFIDPHIASSFHYDIHPMPLYSLIKELAGQSAIAGVIISFTLALLMSILLVNFNTSVFFINERTFLPAILYVLFSGLFPYYQVLNPVLPAAVLLMISLRRIMDAYRKNGTAFNFFDAAILISIASLMYANFIWFGLLVIIGIAILRTGNLKEIFLAVLGLCTPPVLIAGIYYVTGRDLSLLAADVKYNLFETAGSYYFSRTTILSLMIIGLFCLISVFYLLSVMNGKKIKSRKTFTELFWILIISFIIYFAVPSVSVEVVYIAAIPLSYFIAHYCIFSKKKILPDILFSLFFLMVLVIQVIYLS